jgi:plasmid rolling circle replication initiator protein Rep
MKVLINDKEAEMQFREEIKYQKVVKDFFELEKNKKIETREKNFEYESKFLFVVLWLKEIRIVQENEGKLIIKEEFLNEVNSTLKLFNS